MKWRKSTEDWSDLDALQVPSRHRVELLLRQRSLHGQLIIIIILCPNSQTIFRQFSDLRQSYDNWRIHRTLTTIIRLILRQNITITF